ncbi:MAG: toll/interleukin-1 receptor domain-containing protein [Clostridia bacterium]|nr:toll/interleukin-1 receptor domain-containing protein [Clostridia bacterium]
MSVLKCKTRGGCSAQGKARVYLCAHPDDLAEYLDDICDSILKLSDCAIYYRDITAAEPAHDELFDALSLMKLFVVPVTSKFLFESNSARELEFKFATENHIPVLPLLYEQGLEYDFNEICGDLHILNENAVSDNFSSYEQQLKKFIDRVVLDDTTAERVRSAFESYVFLSYRKKDRRAAQRLMRLIHQNELCRDVAIWYDEFLSPGENFNEGIKEALFKSRLFVLAVTPNLLEKNNYVMQIEFPMAKDAGKPVLAVELEPTDARALRESYDGLDELIGAAETHRLFAALTERLREDGEALCEDAAHLFFIGLAYLCGIDVEKNAETALSLITRASDAGLLEATEKLVDMYVTGDGVPRDTKKAYEYQERMLEARRKAYDTDSIEQNALDYADAIIEAKNLAVISGCLNACGIKRMLKKQVRELEYITEDIGEWTLELKSRVAIIYGLLAETAESLDELDEAIDFAFEAHSYALDATEQDCENEEFVAILFMICVIIANLYITKKDDEGMEWLSLSEDCVLAQMKKFPESRSLAWVYIQTMGAKSRYLLLEENFEGAKEANLKALELTRRIYETAPSEKHRETLVGVLCSLSYIYKKLGDHESAIAAAKETAELQSEQKRLSDNSKLCDCYMILYFAYEAAEKYEQARDTLLLANECMKRPLQTRNTETCLRMRKQLLNLFWELSDVYEKLGDMDSAYLYFRRYQALKDIIDESNKAWHRLGEEMNTSDS